MMIRIKKLNENATMPSRAHEADAGADLFACLTEEVHIPPHSTVKIPTGIAVEVPLGWFGAIFARSGLATKNSLRPANCVGVCDCGYTGEYIVPLHNDSDREKVIKPNERIAQLVIMPCMKADFVWVNDLDETDRGDGGFGSSGK
nr:MAG TPA: dUTPase [Caudoviricetes sp.]